MWCLQSSQTGKFVISPLWLPELGREQGTGHQWDAHLLWNKLWPWSTGFVYVLNLNIVQLPVIRQTDQYILSYNGNVDSFIYSRSGFDDVEW
jgi:hypothetical protein